MRDDEHAATKITAAPTTAKHVISDELPASINRAISKSTHLTPLDMKEIRCKVDLDHGLQHKKRPRGKGTPSENARALVSHMLNKDTEAGIGDQEQSMTQIAQSVKPIIDRFNAVLVSFCLIYHLSREVKARSGLQICCLQLPPSRLSHLLLPGSRR